MARLRVPQQAFRNFLSILLGFALGAANNLVVLPWAFGSELEAWGLVRVAAAWATLLAPFLAFGSPAAMNRFKGNLEKDGRMARLNGTLLWPLLILFTFGIALPSWWMPDTLAALLDLEGGDAKAVRPIAILGGIMALQTYLAGYLSTRLKTALATFARETFFKFGYLALGIALGVGWLNVGSFLPAFVALQTIVLLLLIAQALANRFTLNLAGLEDATLRTEAWRYGGTMVLGSSALIILSQIDVIMVGRLMDLSVVPAFTIAVFIATVTGIPPRAFSRLLQPLIASALHAADEKETWRLVGMTHRNMLLIGGWILTCIWVCMPEINRILPEPFRGLEWVVLTIGIARVLQGSAIGTNILLGQSDHYRHTILLNWMCVAIAVPLNLLLIPDSAAGWGMTGAALATLAALGASITARQWVVWRIWHRYVPNGKSIAILIALALPAISIVHWQPAGPAWLYLLLKSAVVTAWVALCAWKFNLAPEAWAQVSAKLARSPKPQ